MACPTCDHTMETILAIDDCRRHWCPRCGTIRTVFFTLNGGDTVEDYVPKLVERCREFEPCLWPLDSVNPKFRETWHRIGIAESINLPAGRKP